MTLIRYNRPYSKMPAFTDFFENFSNANFPSVKWASTPKVNVKETSEAYEIELAAPGLLKEDFNIEINEGALYVSYEHKKEEEREDTEGYKVREFSQSSFSRSFTLPENIDEEQIAATYENGILGISIPKVEVKAPEVRKVAIA